MVARLRERLEFLGFEAEDSDDKALGEFLADASRMITAEIGMVFLPSELESLAIDVAAGEYLLNKKATGNLEGFDNQAVVKQLQEGDTSVTYALASGSSTPEERLDALIEHLRRLPAGLMAAWRCLRW